MLCVGCRIRRKALFSPSCREAAILDKESFVPALTFTSLTNIHGLEETDSNVHSDNSKIVCQINKNNNFTYGL